MVCSKCGWVSSWFTFVQANSLLVSRTEPRLLRSRCLPFHYSLKALKPSGHYMYRTVVNLCTASLTFSNSTFCPHSVFMCFVWIWEQTAIISLYNINWLVCITETECLLCGTDWIFIYRQFNIQQFYVLPTQCIYVFCVDLKTNSDYFPIQH